MTDITLQFDHQAQESMKELMTFYKVNNKADLIAKGMSLLKIAAHIQKTDGELFARKGNSETKIIVR